MRIGREHLPYPVVLTAAWSACLLLIAAGGWILGQAVGRLSVVIAPLAIAVLLAAMLRPLVDRVPGRIPRSLAALGVLLGLVLAVAGSLALVGAQLASGLPEMRDKLRSGTDAALVWLEEGPLHLTADRLQEAVAQVRTWFESNSERVASGALQFGHTAVDAVAGTLICLVALFFFLYHGEKLWEFFVRWFPAAARTRVDGAFRDGWASLGAYTRTQLIVAAINAAGVGIGAWALGVPFVIPIVVVVFLCSFVPVIGTLVSGLVPAVLALVEKGPWIAVAMIAIVVVVHELEAHVLQPVLMGHAVALHPLAVILVVTSGTYLFGIVGALFAVPATALVNGVARHLLAREGDTGPGLVPEVDEVNGPDRVTGHDAVSDPDAQVPPASVGPDGPAAVTAPDDPRTHP